MEEIEKKAKRDPRLIIEVPKEFHCEIKQRAAKRGVSLKLWILRAIRKAIEQEEKYN